MTRGWKPSPWVTKGGLAASVAGAALMVALASGPAHADMQSELAEVKAENAELREMVRDLKQDMQILQKTVAKTTEVVASPKTPPKMVTSGNENVSVTVSGHVNRMLFYADDGDQSQVFNSDNKVSSTRLNITGKAKLDDDLTLGGTVEVELRSNGSDLVTMGQETEANSGVALTERKAEVFAESKKFGKLFLGQGSQAADGITEIDLSGTTVISASSMGADVGAALLFRRAGTALSSGQTVGGLLNNFDQSRLDRVRYDTPDLWGFVGSASYADNDIYDAALRYGGKFPGFEVAAGIGYTDRTTQVIGNSFNQISGSAAVKASFGTSLQGAYAVRDFETLNRDEAEFWWIKLGQEFPTLVPWGATAISIDYGHGDDQGLNGTEGHWVSFAAVQQIKKAATELYFSVGDYDVDIPGIPTDDIFIATLGARVKF